MDRVRTIHGLAGQPEISTDLAGRVRQQPVAAYIGEEAEPHFRHRKFCPLRYHAVAAVRGQPDAAPHHDAVHERDIRFWKFGDAGIEDVFLAPQYLAEVALDLRAFPERADIAARTEPAFAGAFEQDHRHRRISLECIQRLVDVAEHL